MAQSFTFNLTNPTDTVQPGNIFQSTASVIDAGLGQDVGELLEQLQVAGTFNPQYSKYISYKNAFIFLGDSGSQVKAAFYFLNSGNFSPIVDINLTGNSFLRTAPTVVTGLVDNNGDTGEGVWFSATLAGFGRQILIRFDSTEADDPIIEVTSNTSTLSQAIPSPTIWLEGDNRGWVVTQTGFSSNLAYIDNVASAIGSGLRFAAIVALGNPNGVFPKQIKVDSINNRLILVSNSNSRCFQVVNTQTLTLEATFNQGEAMDVIYVEHLDQYYLYTSTNGGATHNLDVFDSNLVFVKTITNPLGGGATNINKATMTYVFSTKSILFKGIAATHGYAFWNIDTETLGGFENGTIINGSNFDNLFNVFTPDGKYIQRLNSTTGTVIQILEVSTETRFSAIQNTELPLAVGKFREAGSFTSNEVNYIGGTGNAIPNNLINIFTGAERIGTGLGKIAVSTQAGGQSYQDIVESVQNQDIVITDLYIRTNDISQANRPITVNFKDPNGSSYNEEYFPEISPLNAQIVVQDLPFEFISNAINTISYSIDPNTDVELIFTYEEFDRAKENNQYPDVDRLNRLLGVGKYAKSAKGIDLDFKAKPLEVQIYNPLMTVFVQTKSALSLKKIDLDKPHQIEITNPLAKIIVKRKFKV